MASPTPVFNTSDEFVGYKNMKTQLFEQLRKFERWAEAKKWSKFHVEGPYDSWAYPSDERGIRGAMHSIFAGDVEAFRKDPVYMNSYLRGLELTMAAWGWELYLRREIPATEKDPLQTWSNSAEKLRRILRSAELFGCHAEAESIRKYGSILKERGCSLTDSAGNDLSSLFVSPRTTATTTMTTSETGRDTTQSSAEMMIVSHHHQQQQISSHASNGKKLKIRVRHGKSGTAVADRSIVSNDKHSISASTSTSAAVSTMLSPPLYNSSDGGQSSGATLTAPAALAATAKPVDVVGSNAGNESSIVADSIILDHRSSYVGSATHDGDDDKDRYKDYDYDDDWCVSDSDSEGSGDHHAVNDSDNDNDNEPITTIGISSSPQPSINHRTDSSNSSSSSRGDGIRRLSSSTLIRTSRQNLFELDLHNNDNHPDNHPDNHRSNSSSSSSSSSSSDDHYRRDSESSNKALSLPVSPKVSWAHSQTKEVHSSSTVRTSMLPPDVVELIEKEPLVSAPGSPVSPPFHKTTNRKRYYAPTTGGNPLAFPSSLLEMKSWLSANDDTQTTAPPTTTSTLTSTSTPSKTPSDSLIPNGAENTTTPLPTRKNINNSNSTSTTTPVVTAVPGAASASQLSPPRTPVYGDDDTDIYQAQGGGGGKFKCWYLLNKEPHPLDLKLKSMSDARQTLSASKRAGQVGVSLTPSSSTSSVAGTPASFIKSSLRSPGSTSKKSMSLRVCFDLPDSNEEAFWTQWRDVGSDAAYVPGAATAGGASSPGGSGDTRLLSKYKVYEKGEFRSSSIHAVPNEDRDYWGDGNDAVVGDDGEYDYYDHDCGDDDDDDGDDDGEFEYAEFDDDNEVSVGDDGEGLSGAAVRGGGIGIEEDDDNDDAAFERMLRKAKELNQQEEEALEKEIENEATR